MPVQVSGVVGADDVDLPGAVDQLDNDLAVSARNFVSDTGNDLWNFVLTFMSLGVTLLAVFQV